MNSATSLAETIKKTSYSARNPFSAILLHRQVLNPGCVHHSKYHLELSIDGDALSYCPGDSLGVIPRNDPALIQEILSLLGFTGNERMADGSTLHHQLCNHCSVTTLSIPFVTALRSGFGNRPEPAHADSASQLHLNFGRGTQLVDLLLQFRPRAGLFEPQQLVSLLPKLQPRLYSIASSLKTFPNQAHLLVVLVSYAIGGRSREGVCSSFLTKRTQPGDKIPVFIHSAKHFHLPDDPDASIIMIGTGTGLAPFRAFVQERQAVGSKGKHWLFFGERKASRDCFYRDEWENYVHCGLLSRMDTAFSQDQDEKIYVQHRMAEHKRELWRWISEGAYLYVCGDAAGMAKDIDATLVNIAQSEGGMAQEQAAAFIHQLHQDRRYRRDVY